jgi:hypothetical protein
LVVDNNMAVRVADDAGLVEPEIVCVGTTPDSQKNMRANDFRGADVAIDADGDIAIPSFSRISLIAAETSSSSRWTSRGPFSTTVTSLPKRR